MTMDCEEKRLRNEKMREAFSRLEGPICDLKYMSVIAETLLDDVLDLSHAEKIEDGYCFTLTSDQVEATTFAILQVGDMIRTLNANYFAILNAHETEPQS
jgi:hypothetical protein